MLKNQEKNFKNFKEAEENRQKSRKPGKTVKNIEKRTKVANPPKMWKTEKTPSKISKNHLKFQNTKKKLQKFQTT